MKCFLRKRFSYEICERFAQTFLYRIHVKINNFSLSTEIRFQNFDRAFQEKFRKVIPFKLKLQKILQNLSHLH
ncbi:hypothetical protein LEP1GSC133_2966 [Leptospira borgpetersenii serovar Pomona str. 200901868]|uniref:Uncharacterized protein n=1 Tax=Leptospira borgpetersenii serovar Pomona str. 200901868 TaxID=1192866 RepID=M6W6A2_LEPBO|nr:hypothetical protein LEP1GSC133_2966 [Leptospira borgpetersenii serovar Pomona str. 200901868]